MQAQLASNVTCRHARGQKLMQSSAGYGERGSNCSLSQRQNYGYHRIGKGTTDSPAESNFIEHSIGREKSEKGSPKRGRQAPMLHHLGFSYLASSFHYILRKVTAFYNGFLGDVAGESRIGNDQAPMVEPYFSIPVLPHP